MFVPLIFDLVLLGVFVMQGESSDGSLAHARAPTDHSLAVYTYFTYQKNDSWWTKGPVIIVTVLQLIFSSYLTCEWV